MAGGAFSQSTLPPMASGLRMVANRMLEYLREVILLREIDPMENFFTHWSLVNNFKLK
jgi:hypothetical protein